MAKSALHTSAGLDLVDDLRREIADGLDINEADEAGLTPLHHACIHWSFESAKILLEAGADVDPKINGVIRRYYGWSAAETTTWHGSNCCSTTAPTQ